MKTISVKSKDALRKRIQRYLSAPYLPERQMLRSKILPTFAALGRTVIFGGMPRDIARRGAAGFASDIDLVVDPNDLGRYKALMVELSGRPNRFGGFGIKMGNWHVDVWALSDTWARKAGLRPVHRFDHLLNTTFFDLDAIMYDVSSRKILVSSDYFDRIQSKILDLNLHENPNPMGSAVRALRRGLLWDVHLSERLADYVLASIRSHGWRDLVKLDAQAFRYSVLDGADEGFVMHSLEHRLKRDNCWVAEKITNGPEQLGFDEALRQES